MLTLKLTPEQLNIIGQALGEIPYRAAAPVIRVIEAQIAEQTKQPAPVAAEKANGAHVDAAEFGQAHA